MQPKPLCTHQPEQSYQLISTVEREIIFFYTKGQACFLYNSQHFMLCVTKFQVLIISIPRQEISGWRTGEALTAQDLEKPLPLRKDNTEFGLKVWIFQVQWVAMARKTWGPIWQKSFLECCSKYYAIFA